MPSRVRPALVILMLPSLACHADTPVAYQPDIVGVGRLFLVALDVPIEAPALEIDVPDTVELLDRTPLPTDGALRKYYFRSLQPAERTEIVFAHPQGEVTIPIEIWSFEDLREFRTLKGTQLPRRWPLGEELPELKQGQTITTDADREAARQGDPPGENWLELSDEQVWDLQPDSTIPRWHYVNLRDGCPIHGKEIYREAAWYPWLHPDESGEKSKRPVIPYLWKLKCPIGGEIYPTNDFAHGDFTSGEFPDDGIGGGCEYQGKRYGFIAEICQSYCHIPLGLVPACAAGYLATEDVRYVHKALVAMSRMAVEYAYLATMTQHRHRNTRDQVVRLGPAPFSEGPCLFRSGFTVYCISQPHYQKRWAEAYDRIFPAIEQDDRILPFLRSKGFDLESHEDLRRFLEENLFAVWMQGAMDGATKSNEPASQMALARMAECLNYERGDEFMEWLYNGGGQMRHFVTNTFFRDGAPWEATGGYNGTHVRAIAPVVESVAHLREMRPEVYPEARFPEIAHSRRYRSIFDFAMNTVTIDRTYPKIGDDTAGRGYDASFPYYHEMPRRTWQNGGAAAFEHAYELFEEPKFAWALANAPGWEPSPDFPYSREEIEAAAARWPDDWNDDSGLEDGYGLAILRGGRGDAKRALWMMYGQYRGHRHSDVMHMGLDAQRSEILGQLGYPRGRDWTYCWITHNLARQIPYVALTGVCEYMADAGPVHVAEVRAQGFVDRVSEGEGYELPPDDWQRRTLAIVDVSETESYYVDLYRISGGTDHWWSFHCQQGEFSTEGLDLKRQQGGTLAGAALAYGEDPWGWDESLYRSKQALRMPPMYGFAHLYNVSRDTDPQGVWSADWMLENSDRLHFRMTVPQADAAEVAICDGKSPTGGSPYEMKWVMIHNADDEPARTQVANVMELYRRDPLIRSVRALELSGQDEHGFGAWGLVVELRNGRTDWIFAAADPSAVHTAAGGFEFAGRFGLYSEREGAPPQLVLVGGTRLTRDGSGIVREQGEYRAEIVAVDREEHSITIAPAPADPQALVGRFVHISNPVRRVAYEVLSAEPTDDGARLHLGYDSRIGTGKVIGHADHLVKTDTPFRLAGYRYYHGARLVNAEQSAEYRMIDVHGSWVDVDANAHPECTAQTLQEQFPADSWFEIFDYGVGDAVTCAEIARLPGDAGARQ